MKILRIKPGMMVSELEIECDKCKKKFIRTVFEGGRMKCPHCGNKRFVSFNNGAVANQLMDCN